MRVRHLRLMLSWHNKQQQELANLIRMQTARLINPHIKNKITDVAEFWPFPWDNMSERSIETSMNSEMKINKNKRMVNLLNNIGNE